MAGSVGVKALHFLALSCVGAILLGIGAKISYLVSVDALPMLDYFDGFTLILIGCGFLVFVAYRILSGGK